MIFEFNPDAVTPQVEVEIASSPAAPRVVTPRTVEERITSAKARAMQSVKDSSPVGGQYGWEYPVSYYLDFAGHETSYYEFRRLLHLLYFLGDPKFTKAYLNRDGIYEPHTGVWVRGDHVMPISDLKTAAARRIAELGLSEIRILEYLAVPHPWTEQKPFDAEDFVTRMQRFRETKD